MLSHIILRQTCSKLRNESIEDSEVDNRLEKKKIVDLVKDAKLIAGFSPSRLFRIGLNDSRHINTAWLPRQLQNDGLRSHFFQNEFLQNSGHFRGLNFGEWKN